VLFILFILVVYKNNNCDKMKIGWQLKEELPLFMIVLLLVTGLIWYLGYELSPSFGTGFLIAAIVTSSEVIINGMKRKKK
jgi:hypothetical protein